LNILHSVLDENGEKTSMIGFDIHEATFAPAEKKTNYKADD